MVQHIKTAVATLVLGLSFLGYLRASQPTPPPTAATEVSALPDPFVFPAPHTLFDKFPVIPTSVQGLGGPITVKLVRAPLDEEGEELWGSFTVSTRVIEIESNASSEFRWHILGHELCHAALLDSGLGNTISDAGQEALCDTFGTARVQEMRGW